MKKILEFWWEFLLTVIIGTTVGILVGYFIILVINLCL